MTVWRRRIVTLLVGSFLGAAPVCAVNFFYQAAQYNSELFTSGLLGQPAYNGVGSVNITEGNSQFRATGVLVANDWVLTAAHNWVADSVTGLSFNWNGKSYAANPFAWQQHPGWLISPQVGLTQGWDLALFQLSEPVVGATPAKLFSGTPTFGSDLTFFGAGLTGTGGALEANPDAILYAGTNTLDRILAMDSPYGSGGLLAFDFDDGTSFHNSLKSAGVADIDGAYMNALSGITLTGEISNSVTSSLEATSAPGDSGGPAFIDNGNGPELVGLVSWGVNPTRAANLYGSGLGDITYLTDLSEHYEWINAVIPEPSASALIICSLSVFFVFCRRNM